MKRRPEDTLKELAERFHKAKVYALWQAASAAEKAEAWEAADKKTRRAIRAQEKPLSRSERRQLRKAAQKAGIKPEYRVPGHQRSQRSPEPS